MSLAFFIHVSSGAAVKSSKGLESVFKKSVEKNEGETEEGKYRHRGSEWLCIEKRLWLSTVFRFGLFGWVPGIRSAGFTFVSCTTYVNRIITII